MSKNRDSYPEEEIRIIEFTEDDAEEISDLFKEVWPKATEYPEGWRKKRAYSAEQIINDMRNGYHYFGARLKGKIVGVYKAIVTDKGLFGEQQAVHESCRNTGLASAMYQQFAKYAIEHGCKRNYCNILVGHKPSEHMMKRFGFRPWGEPYEQYPGMLVQMYERPLDE